MFERVRKWVSLSGAIIAASIFWRMVVAGLVKYAADLSQDQALHVFIPAAFVVGVCLYFSKHKLARALGFDD